MTFDPRDVFDNPLHEYYNHASVFSVVSLVYDMQL